MFTMGQTCRWLTLSHMGGMFTTRAGSVVTRIENAGLSSKGCAIQALMHTTRLMKKRPCRLGGERSRRGNGHGPATCP